MVTAINLIKKNTWEEINDLVTQETGRLVCEYGYGPKGGLKSN